MALLLSACGGNVAQPESTSPDARAGLMKISSPAFIPGGSIPAEYTCDGQNVSPPLIITGVPSDAKSIAIVALDVNAPGGVFFHWAAWNLPGEDQVIESGSLPAGAVEGKNSSGGTGYTGPCPSEGTHQYFFMVTALDTTLSLPDTAGAPEVLRATIDHTLSQVSLPATYSK